MELRVLVMDKRRAIQIMTKAAGNVCGYIGFVQDRNTKLNVPNTLLKNANISHVLRLRGCCIISNINQSLWRRK